jgi:hypothetical protein
VNHFLKQIALWCTIVASIVGLPVLAQQASAASNSGVSQGAVYTTHSDGSITESPAKPTESPAKPTESPAKPVAAAACTAHHNYTSTLNWSSTDSVVVYSNAAWSRAIWQWDECNGGIKEVFSLDTDCHFRTRLWSMDRYGNTTTYWGVVGDRGGTCNARPGYAAWQKNGALKTWSAAGTELSATPYTSASPFQWLIYLPSGCSGGGEQILNWWSGHGYLGFWWSPRWSDSSC